MEGTTVLARLETSIQTLTDVQTKQTEAVNKLSANVNTLSRVLLGEDETETPGLLQEHRKMKEEVDELLAFKRVVIGLFTKALPKVAGIGLFIYMVAGGSPQDIVDAMLGLF